MVLGLAEIPRDSALYPAELHSFFNNRVPRLWHVGETSLLKGRILGILSARKIEPDLALKTSELIRQLGSLGATFISGWHSPLEEEALRILLSRSARIIFCFAKSLDKFILSVEIENLVSQGRGLLLTHCSPKAKRISRDASLRRNQLVVGLSKGLLILSGPPGSASFKLAKLALNSGKTVFAVQHPMNRDLLALAALPASGEAIQRVFQ